MKCYFCNSDINDKAHRNYYSCNLCALSNGLVGVYTDYNDKNEVVSLEIGFMMDGNTISTWYDAATNISEVLHFAKIKVEGVAFTPTNVKQRITKFMAFV